MRNGTARIRAADPAEAQAQVYLGGKPGVVATGRQACSTAMSNIREHGPARWRRAWQAKDLSPRSIVRLITWLWQSRSRLERVTSSRAWPRGRRRQKASRGEWARRQRPGDLSNLQPVSESPGAFLARKGPGGSHRQPVVGFAVQRCSDQGASKLAHVLVCTTQGLRLQRHVRQGRRSAQNRTAVLAQAGDSGAGLRTLEEARRTVVHRQRLSGPQWVCARQTPWPASCKRIQDPMRPSPKPAMLFWALNGFAVTMRQVDGWQNLERTIEPSLDLCRRLAVRTGSYAKIKFPPTRHDLHQASSSYVAN